MVQTPTKHLTFEEYLTYADGTDNRYEFFEGSLILIPPATGAHEAIINFLYICFYQEIQRLQLDWRVRQGGTGIQTTKTRSRLPDVSVITAEQADSVRSQTAIIQSPPLLIVEVVSPDSINRDYRYKRSEYAAFEISEYWIVDPLEAKVSVLLLNEGFYDVTEFKGRNRLLSRTFPELTLTVEQILNAQ